MPENETEHERQEADPSEAPEDTALGPFTLKLTRRAFPIPDELRPILGEQVLITLGRTNRELYIFEAEAGKAFVRRVRYGPLPSPDRRGDFVRYFSGYAHIVPVEDDTIRIPKVLTDIVGLRSRIVVRGLADRLCVSSPETAQEEQERLFSEENLTALREVDDFV